MSLYPSAQTTTMTPEPAPAPRRKRNRKKIAFISAVATVLLAPVAAWAAVQLFGFGTFSADAATPGILTINGGPNAPHTTGTLAPGQTVGVTGSVHNPNDYPVQITEIAVKTSSLHATPPAGHVESECKITLVGGTTTATGFPAHAPDGALPGTRFTPTGAPITIAPGGDANVTVVGIIHQDSTASVMCGVTGEYAVIGQVGS